MQQPEGGPIVMPQLPATSALRGRRAGQAQPTPLAARPPPPPQPQCTPVDNYAGAVAARESMVEQLPSPLGEPLRAAAATKRKRSSAAVKRAVAVETMTSAPPCLVKTKPPSPQAAAAAAHQVVLSAAEPVISSQPSPAPPRQNPSATVAENDDGGEQCDGDSERVKRPKRADASSQYVPYPQATSHHCIQDCVNAIRECIVAQDSNKAYVHDVPKGLLRSHQKKRSLVFLARQRRTAQNNGCCKSSWHVFLQERLQSGSGLPFGEQMQHIRDEYRDGKQQQQQPLQCSQATGPSAVNALDQSWSTVKQPVSRETTVTGKEHTSARKK